MLLLSARGLFDFWHWLHYGAGKRWSISSSRIALILFFSAVGWLILASLIENRGLRYSQPARYPAPARARAADAVPQCAGSDYQYHNHHDRVYRKSASISRHCWLARGRWNAGYLFRFANLVKILLPASLFSLKQDEYRRLSHHGGPLTGTVERYRFVPSRRAADTRACILSRGPRSPHANFALRGIGSVVANYDVDRHEDADKANQALKDAVTALMETDIRRLIIRRRSPVLSV